MADKKISQLTTLVQANVDVTADFLPIVDTGAVETKKVTPQALVQAGATGATLALADGAAATPSLTNTGDENTGIFFPAADTIAFSEGGVEAMRLDSSGNLGIGTAGTTARGNLDVSSANIGTSVTRSIHLGYSAADFYGYRLANTNTAGSFAAGTFSIQRGNTAAWVDNFVIDDTGNLGIGTSSPGAMLDVAGNVRAGSVNQVRLGSGVFAASLASISASVGRLDIGTTSASDISFFANNTERLRIESSGSIRAGAAAALATTATDGFLYVPTCAGTPTGTPTAITGMAPIVVNTTNNKLYFYSGGAWRDAGP